MDLSNLKHWDYRFNITMYERQVTTGEKCRLL